eukprot:tig00000912_g5442.t1
MSRPSRSAGPSGGSKANWQSVLKTYLLGADPEIVETRRRVIDLIRSDPVFCFDVESNKEAHRERVLQQLRVLAKNGFLRVRDLKNKPARYFAAFEGVCYFDLSLVIKTGVQFSLWGGSVLNLGTEMHHAKLLDLIDKIDLPGCFAMTGGSHGSNVRGIETTAAWDSAAREFVVHTPNDSALKWWIGNAATHGLMATVFARLLVGGEDHGVHAILVPLRDPDTGKTLPGVTIGDCGPKVGLNGVDNGWMRFERVRVPREALLDRFGGVSEAGVYKTPIPNAEKRFGAVVGELTGGRVGLAMGSVAVLRLATAIAIRYGAARRQFGPPTGPEISVLDYQTQQIKLMPLLAAAYAHDFAARYLVRRYTERGAGDAAEVHALSAGLKAHITSHTAKALQVCREACGGHGYSAYNRIGTLRNDHDIFTTFEGDNTVLMQQVAKALLTEYRRRAGRGVSGALAYVGHAVRVWAMEHRPVDAAGDLSDPAYQLAAFGFREGRLVHTAALRLRKRTAAGLGFFEAWNECLGHLLEAAQAHVERVILEQFQAAVRGAPPECRPVLKALCDLYALSRIDSDLGSFRAHEFLTRGRGKEVRRQVVALCREVRVSALDLIDAWGIPDELLNAPLGKAQGDPFEHYLNRVGVTRARL